MKGGTWVPSGCIFFYFTFIWCFKSFAVLYLGICTSLLIIWILIVLQNEKHLEKQIVLRSRAQQPQHTVFNYSAAHDFILKYMLSFVSSLLYWDSSFAGFSLLLLPVAAY